MRHILKKSFLKNLETEPEGNLGSFFIPVDSLDYYHYLWHVPPVPERTFSGNLVKVMPPHKRCIAQIKYKNSHISILHESIKRPGVYICEFYLLPKGSKVPVRHRFNYDQNDIPLDFRTHKLKDEASKQISKVEAEFMEWRGRIMGEVQDGKVSTRISFARAIGKYEAGLDAYEPQMSAKEKKVAKVYFTSYRAFFAQSSLEKIRIPNVKAYRAHLIQEKKLALATVNRYLSRLSRFFRWAMEQTYLTHNPVQGTAFSPKQLNYRKDYLKNVEIRQILLATEGKTRLYFFIIGGLGLRLSAAVSLRFDQFDFANQVLHLTAEQAKNKVASDIGMHTRLCALVTEWKALHPDWVYLFGPDKPVFNAKREFAKLYEVLPWMKERGVTSHIFRHSWTTALQMAGAPLDLRQRSLTHMDPRSTEIYSHVIYTEKDREFIEKAAGILMPDDIGLS